MGTARSLLLFTLLAAPAAAQSFVNWESPHVHPLEMTPDGTRLLAVNTPDNRLEVFALTSGTPVPVFAVPVGLDPVSVRARTNREVWVVNHVSDSVSIVDLVTRNVVATLPTDDEPADVVFAPVLAGLAINPPHAVSPERAFVTCSQANTLLVFDANAPASAPQRIALRGEEPRALAVNPLRGEVYVAFFVSGNQTTILAGQQPTPRAFPPKAVLDPAGPYGGFSPPPNSGANYDPPINPALPAPPRSGLIVRRNSAGEWRDDNIGDWTALVSGSQAALSGRPVGWKLLDHDVAIVDARTLEVRYHTGITNLCMALGVNRQTSEVSVVGTDATNQIRFLSNLTGVFLRVQLGRFQPDSPASTVQDLNPQLDYGSGTVAQAVRDRGLADPRGIVWNIAGTRAYVSGMGSNNVVVLGANGARVGNGTPIGVGEGPTGLALDETRHRLYVLDKFEAAISVVDTDASTELARVPFFDPSLAAIQLGRRHLYDARATSGTGVVACASCHPDGRTDRLAWDLGEPDGNVKPVDEQEIYPPKVFDPWHPMKGPLLTETLQDIIGKEPFHWRGDRDGIEEFNPLYEDLLGDDEQLSAAEMQELEDFLATLFFPPNPFRNFDNSLSTNLPLEGHVSTGVFSPAGTPLPNGNAANGKVLYSPPELLAGDRACATCHTLGNSVGTDTHLSGGMFSPRPPGPNGERYHALSVASRTALKNAHYRDLYERVGYDTLSTESVVGFGYSPEGSVDSLTRFISPNFDFTNDQEVADMIAFLLSVSGELGSGGSSTDPLSPPGTAGRHTHAAVGAQVTFDSTSPGAATVARLDAMIALANASAVGLVAKGRNLLLARGYRYDGANQFQSDRALESLDRTALLAQAGPGRELTFTVVPLGSQTRIGIDRDLDGIFDRDELDAGANPGDPTSRPKLHFVPPGRRP